MLPGDLIKQHPFVDAQYLLTQQYLASAKAEGYIKVPKTMLIHSRTMGIGMDEVILYSVLHDRANLSWQNSQNPDYKGDKSWLVDAQGNILVYYANSTTCTLLGWSMAKTKRVYKSLQNCGLLSSEPVMQGKVQTGRRHRLRAWLGDHGSYADIVARRYRPLTGATIDDSIGAYYVLPKYMLSAPEYHDLNLRSILLYAIILDRLHEGASNGHRIDAGTDLVWTTIDADIATQELDCSAPTLIAAFKGLEEQGWIHRQDRKFGARWHIYARTPAPMGGTMVEVEQEEPPEETPVQEESSSGEETSPQTLKSDTTTSPNEQLLNSDTTFSNSDTPLSKSDIIRVKKRPPNKPSCINPPYSNPSEGVSIPASASAARDIGCCPPQEKSQYLRAIDNRTKAWDLLHSDALIDLVYGDPLRVIPEGAAEACMEIRDELEDIIVEDLTNNSQYIVYGREPVARTEVLARYEQLDPYIVCILVAKIHEAAPHIKQRKEYLHKALYLAPVQHKEYAYMLRMSNGLP